MSTIAIVTPWRDHLELADDYFRAVDAEPPDQLVIVDDGSVEPLTFAAIRIEPTGFCGANNAGLAVVETDHVLFLNNDVRALRRNWLQGIRDGVESGVILGPLRYDRHGDVDGVNYPYVDGWCAAMTVEDARRVLWDERYDANGPSYYSDNAFSFDARLAGMRLREITPGLLHLGGRTGGGGPQFQHAVTANKIIWEQHVTEALCGS